MPGLLQAPADITKDRNVVAVAYVFEERRYPFEAKSTLNLDGRAQYVAPTLW